MVPVIMMMNRLASRRRRMAELQKIEAKSPEKEYCRTCLSTEALTKIFANKETVEKRSEDLKLATGLEIQYNDGLSQKICKKCIKLIHIALKFRRTSRKAQKFLRNMKSDTIKHYLTTENGADNVQNDELAIDNDNNDCDFDSYQDDFHSNNYESDDLNTKQIKQKPTVLRKKHVKNPISSTYKCNKCNKEFRMRATYYSHMRFHTNYCICESCGKRCRNNNQLQEHKRARHGLGKIHKCAYCEYSSATKEALTIHERRHTGERPYICDHCGASFFRRSTLVQHIAIHLSETNFQCDMCPKRLKSKKFLQIHKHNVHTGKRYGYLCPTCERRFDKPNKVRAHMRRVHGLPNEQHGAIVRINL